MPTNGERPAQDLGAAPSEPARRVREVRRAGDLEGARRLALELVAGHREEAELLYETACVHDQLGLEAEAVPLYEAALALGLPEESARGAYLGLGSTLRTLSVVADTSADAHVAAYREAIRFYARDIERTWT